MLCLGSCKISELCYKWSILQKNNIKMTMKWSFFYNSFVKFNGKEIRDEY